MSSAVSANDRVESRANAGLWNQFWFQPSDPFVLSVLRVLTGMMATYLVASYTSDLYRWFGPDGVLPTTVVHRLLDGISAEAVPANFHWSYLNIFADSNTALSIVHGLGLLVLIAFTLGFFSRFTSVLAFVVVASYIHRAPMITGPFETVLSFVLFYLCFGPCGAYLSLDQWLAKRKKSGDGMDQQPHELKISWTANVAVRLIQVHLAAFYLLLGLSKLSGRPGNEFFGSWWTGEAIWWLMTRSESRLVDATFLANDVGLLLVNLVTHAIVAFELLFPVLIWRPALRRWFLIANVVIWILLALLTGLVSYAVMLVIASLAFVPSSVLRSFFIARLGFRNLEVAEGSQN